MDYRMKREYLKNNFWGNNAEDEKYLTEYLTRDIFHKWNDKLEILTRICDYYSYMFRFYPDGRLVLQMMNANTKDTDSEWRGKDDCGHLEYETLDHIATIIRMCNQWENSFHKMESCCTRMISAATSYEAKIRYILEDKQIR